MKINSLLTGSGKLGNVVFAQSAGGTIARQYTESVSNPSTDAQVAVRARFKLLSQLSAALSDSIAIPKNGRVSSRNQFTSVNYPQTDYVNGEAVATYENLQLTNSQTPLAAVSIDRSSGIATNVSLNRSVVNSVSRVIYAMYQVDDAYGLQLLGSVVQTEPGDNGRFAASLPLSTGQICVYAYGMRDLNAKAAAKYESYSVATGEDIARLVAQRSITNADYGFTITRATTLYADEQVSVEIPEGYARIYLTSRGNGTVNGAGVAAIGSTVTVIASPNSGYVFKYWQDARGNIVSTNASYSFTLASTTDLFAVFEETTPPYVLHIDASAEGISSITPSGRVEVPYGDPITLTAVVEEGYAFLNWLARLTGTSSYSALDAQNPVTVTFGPTAFPAGSEIDVSAVAKEAVEVTISSSDTDMGTVSPAGVVSIPVNTGLDVAVTIVEGQEPYFVGWRFIPAGSSAGALVSTQTSFRFVGTQPGRLIAEFSIPSGNVDF